MRRYGLAVVLLIAFAASSAWANVPSPAHCVVDSALINADPYDHPYGTTAAERYQDVTVVLYNGDDAPVGGYLCSDMTFTVIPHPDYPNLGGGPGGNCSGCEGHYTVVCQSTETNALGEMVLRITVGPECAPSMTCPVHVTVGLVEGDIPYPIEVLMNSFDLVPNGDVRGSDFGRFSTAYNDWVLYGIPSPDADFVWVVTPVPQGVWGEISGSDFGAFSTAYMDCCGHPKEPDPANCDPWTDPCP
ncbi:MAG: hypothetical protein KAW17_11325 [Candidatus Eisenbacteria sp.]|nr:hypothetical protein [Candidatus Eisenbacteria bacterium]